MTVNPIFVQKAAAASTALVSDEPDGTFEAIVSAFGNKDSQGDVTEKGAFVESLGKRTAKGSHLPAVWSHQFNNPEMFIGKYFEHEETETGLRLKGRLNLAWAMGQRVYELYKEGLVTEFSWSGRVEDYKVIEKGDPLFDEEKEWLNGARILKVDLWEAGPTFRGANPATELLSVKQSSGLSAVAKAGRVLRSEYVDVLKQSVEMLNTVIEAVDVSDDGKQEKNDSPNSVEPTVDGVQGRKAAVLDPRTRARMTLPIT